MGAGNVIGIVAICGLFGFVAYWWRDKVEGAVFIEGLTKLIGLIVNAEKNITGVKQGVARMDAVIKVADTVLSRDELKVVNKKGGVGKVVQYAFDILKPIITVATLGAIRKN